MKVDGKWVGYGLGDTGDQVIKIQHRLLAAFPKNSQAKTLGVVESGIYDQATADAVSNIQPFLKLPATGIANAATQRALGAIAQPAPAPTRAHRKIWIFTCPGSGANWDQGPSFDLGNRCKDELNLNHQPVYFQKGGYLGFLGGDPTFSYNEVIWDQYLSMEHLLDVNPDAQEALTLALAYCRSKGWDPDTVTDAQLKEIADHLEFEHHDSGYSQSAQGVEEACEMLYGDGGFIHPGAPSQTPSAPGKYRLLRHTLKLLVLFGNPSTKDTGIARKVRSPWLAAKVRNVNYDNDFYAVVPASDKIRPAMYAIIVEAQMSLPFFVHVLRIAARTVPEWAAFSPLLGPFAPFAQIAIAGLAGLNMAMPLFGSMFGMAGSADDTKVDDDLYNLLKPTGILENIPGLLGLVGALPGLDMHGRYPFDPVMMAKAFGFIANFRR